MPTKKPFLHSKVSFSNIVPPLEQDIQRILILLFQHFWVVGLGFFLILDKAKGTRSEKRNPNTKTRVLQNINLCQLHVTSLPADSV